MFLTKEQALARLSSPDNLANKVVREGDKFEIRTIDRGGARVVAPKLSEEDRIEIATRAQLEPAARVAADFNISRQHVQNLKFGRVDSRKYDNGKHDALKQHVAEVRDEIKDTALTKLMLSLGLLNESNMGDLDAKDISVVSANLSKVAANMEERQAADSSMKILIYAPQMKDVEDFKTVEI